ncbi:hypothetical protein cyc_05365 [Cyclospora cayetanensis]|uniref:Uncharacterized protein n=1 Tax=Cyclospora cayetanensis TaxID=88456 RepID=A0A1D3D378_9EIME|nr:hypothetical protein cyc_05365 [Cyclospora cayetanensis]
MESQQGGGPPGGPFPRPGLPLSDEERQAICLDVLLSLARHMSAWRYRDGWGGGAFHTHFGRLSSGALSKVEIESYWQLMGPLLGALGLTPVLGGAPLIDAASCRLRMQPVLLLFLPRLWTAAATAGSACCIRGVGAFSLPMGPLLRLLISCEGFSEVAAEGDEVGRSPHATSPEASWNGAPLEAAAVVRPLPGGLPHECDPLEKDSGGPEGGPRGAPEGARPSLAPSAGSATD